MLHCDISGSLGHIVKVKLIETLSQAPPAAAARQRGEAQQHAAVVLACYQPVTSMAQSPTAARWPAVWRASVRDAQRNAWGSVQVLLGLMVACRRHVCSTVGTAAASLFSFYSIHLSCVFALMQGRRGLQHPLSWLGKQKGHAGS